MRAVLLTLRSRRGVVGLAVVLAVAVFAARLVVDDPHEPILFFLVVPVGLVAAEIGLAGGLVAAAVACTLVAIWDLTAETDLSTYGYVARWTIFVISGVTVGAFAHQRMELEERLLLMAHTDALTSLSNRRHFEQEASRVLDFIRRYGHGGALFVFDIDKFKSINDSLGHAAGDEALRKVSHAIKQRVRATDVAARIGGDEFAILFPETGRKGAEVLARGLLGVIAGEEVGAGEDVRRLSSSVGVVTFSRDDDLDLVKLVGEADRAMYEAKRAGGGRFRFAGEPPVTDTDVTAEHDVGAGPRRV
jgi:diguanylate cyclase (GGDEF)-like protein